MELRQSSDIQAAHMYMASIHVFSLARHLPGTCQKRGRTALQSGRRDVVLCRLMTWYVIFARQTQTLPTSGRLLQLDVAQDLAGNGQA